MRGMSRHIESNNIIFLTILLELVWVVALVAIEDQQAIPTYSSGSSMLLKMSNPIHAFLICCLAVISNSDYLVRWKSVVLIPRCEVVFACNNNKWWHCLALGIDALDYYNLFSIARLYLFCFCTPIWACYNHCSWDNTHHKPSLVKVVDICIVDTILRDCITYKLKPTTNNFWILALSPLVVVFPLEACS